MKNNLPKRKSTRLKYYDYSSKGMYFITICTKDRLELLGNINNECIIYLTEEGNIVKKAIKEVERIFPNVIIDEYIIKPNHLHIIVVITENRHISISRIIKQLKMNVSKKTGYSIWQKSFHEHVIRNEKEYLIIKQYIKNNIINWKQDKYF